MLPDQVLSTTPVSSQFAYPRNIPKRPLIDYEYGGRALADPSEGLRVKVWKGEVIEGDVIFSASGVAPTTVLSIAEPVFDIGISFDQSMRPFVTWQLESGACFFRWFDPTVPGFVITQLPGGTVTPRCAIDDTRDAMVRQGFSDIILAYCRGGHLYFRAERERYQTEHLLKENAGPGLIQIGMNTVLRFQFQLSNAGEGA